MSLGEFNNFSNKSIHLNLIGNDKKLIRFISALHNNKNFVVINNFSKGVVILKKSKFYKKAKLYNEIH